MDSQKYDKSKFPDDMIKVMGLSNYDMIEMMNNDELYQITLKIYNSLTIVKK